jgi:hypothetical protein
MSEPQVLEVRKPSDDELDMAEDQDGLWFCDVCGDEIEELQEVVDMPYTLVAPGSLLRPLTTVHAGCAVKNGYRLRWPSHTGED